MWRLCSENEIFSAFIRKRRGKGRLVGPPVREDLVRREFTATSPDRLWPTDISEHPTAWIPAIVVTPLPMRLPVKQLFVQRECPSRAIFWGDH